MNPRRTNKQRILMELILKAADEGALLTIPELHARIPYTCAYGSLRTSLKFLERDGVLLRERAGSFTLLRPTQKGYSFFR